MLHWTAPSVTHKPLDKKEIHHIDLGWVKKTQTATGVIGSNLVWFYDWSWYAKLYYGDTTEQDMSTDCKNICYNVHSTFHSNLPLTLLSHVLSGGKLLCMLACNLSRSSATHKPMRQKCSFAPVTLDLSKPGPPTVSFLIKSNTFPSTILK